MRPAAVEPHVFHGFTDFRRAEHTSSVASPTKLGQYVASRHGKRVVHLAGNTQEGLQHFLAVVGHQVALVVFADELALFLGGFNGFALAQQIDCLCVSTVVVDGVFVEVDGFFQADDQIASVTFRVTRGLYPRDGWCSCPACSAWL